MGHFGLSEIQATAILEMRLRRLTGLERDKIERRARGAARQDRLLPVVLGDVGLVLQIIKTSSPRSGSATGTSAARRSQRAPGDFDVEDLIADEKMVITITKTGYIKRCR